jgi:hypothetical protein
MIRLGVTHLLSPSHLDQAAVARAAFDYLKRQQTLGRIKGLSPLMVSRA